MAAKKKTRLDVKHIEKALQPLAVSIDSVSVDPANVRLHPDENMRHLRASIRRFGQQRPILIDQNGAIVAGNGTYEAMRLEGYGAIAVVKTTLADADRAGYAIADNRIAELAEWDFQALALQVKSFEEDVAGAIGFSDQEIADMLDVDDGIVPDFQPVTEDQQSRLDEKSPTTCPECGHVWTT